MKTVLFDNKNKYSGFVDMPPPPPQSTQPTQPTLSAQQPLSTQPTQPTQPTQQPQLPSVPQPTQPPPMLPTIINQALLNASDNTSSSSNKINIRHLIINALLIIIITFCVSLLFLTPRSDKDYLLIFLVAVIAGLLYAAIEVVFIKYINNSSGMQSGGDNAYSYYSSENKMSPYTKRNTKGGASFPYRYYDDKYPPSPSF